MYRENQDKHKSIWQLSLFISLCVLALCNALVIALRIQDRPVAFVWLLAETVLIIYLWMHDTFNGRYRTIPIIAIILILAVLLLEQSFLSLEVVTRISSIVRLFLSFVLIVVQILLLYIAEILGRRNLVAIAQKSQDGEGDCGNVESRTEQVTGFALLIALVFFLLGVYFLATYTRSGILGWDTANYSWRARLIDQKGVLAHLTNYDNGLHLVFPSLVALVHRLTQWAFWDAIQFISPILAIMGCLALGLLVYSATRSWFSLIFVVAIAAGIFPIARFVSDLRDNLMAWVLGTLALALLGIASSKKTNGLKYEILGALCLIFTGFSHIAISSIFFITVGIVYFIEFIEWWQSQKTNQLTSVFRSFIKIMYLPLLCYLVFGLSLLSTLSTYLSSITQLGIDTEVIVSSTQHDIQWLVDNLQIYTYWPWVLLGILDLVGTILLREISRPRKLILTWVFVSLSLYFLLPGQLAYRYFLMIPFPALVGLGVNRIWSMIQRWGSVERTAAGIALIVVLLGLIFPFNLANEVQQSISDKPIWFTQKMLTRMYSVNQYIEDELLQPPYIFIAERYEEGIGFSFLWQNVIRATITPDAILDTYLYFGELSSFLEERPSNLPEIISPSTYWWQILERDHVLEGAQGTVFIIDEFNPDLYYDYMYSPYVDIIAPGILIVQKHSMCE